MSIKPGAVVASTPIPVGTIVTVCPFVMHRSQEAWGSIAEVFDPERWIASGTSGKHFDQRRGSSDPNNFLTFGHGARGCIGERLTMGEMLTLVA